MGEACRTFCKLHSTLEMWVAGPFFYNSKEQGGLQRVPEASPTLWKACEGFEESKNSSHILNSGAKGLMSVQGLTEDQTLLEHLETTNLRPFLGMLRDLENSKPLFLWVVVLSLIQDNMPGVLQRMDCAQIICFFYSCNGQRELFQVELLVKKFTFVLRILFLHFQQMTFGIFGGRKASKQLHLVSEHISLWL